MARKMKQGKIEVTVHAHLMTRNFWEYYLLGKPDAHGIVEALVMGHETEIGDVSLDEIKPYLISRTNNLSDLAPAEGWAWADAN